MATEYHPSATGWLRSRSGLGLIAFPSIAAFFLVTEHTPHVLHSRSRTTTAAPEPVP